MGLGMRMSENVPLRLTQSRPMRPRRYPRQSIDRAKRAVAIGDNHEDHHVATPDNELTELDEGGLCAIEQQIRSRSIQRPTKASEPVR